MPSSLIPVGTFLRECNRKSRLYRSWNSRLSVSWSASNDRTANPRRNQEGGHYRSGCVSRWVSRCLHVYTLRRSTLAWTRSNESSRFSTTPPTPQALNVPRYRLHPLKGELKGLWSVTVRANWRLNGPGLHGTYAWKQCPSPGDSVDLLGI